MDKPIGPSLPSPAIRSTHAPYAPQVERFDQLMQAYTKDWPTLYADGSAREVGSYERLATHTLAAIAWVGSTSLGKGVAEAAWAENTLKQSLDRTCNQEEVAPEGTGYPLADEIVRTYQNSDNVGNRARTAVALTHSALKAVSNRMRETLGDSALRGRNIEKLDAAELLLAMEQNAPSSESAEDESFADPLYRYTLTAWANLGPSAEIPQRTKAVAEILHNPCFVYLNNFGLTSLPTLPAGLKNLIASENQLTRLPALPNKLVELDVRDNRLTDLTVLPGLVELDADGNKLGNLSVLPNTLKKVSLERVDLDGIPLECFQYLKEGTKVRLQEQNNAALQAKLASSMKAWGLDVKFLDGYDH